MKRLIIWGGWIVVTLAIAGFFGNKFFGKGDKATFLIGEATHGHFQIEMACETCHTDPFGGQEVMQNACTQCHAEELEEAHDSHPKTKFTDPRNADRVEILDARYCVTCHTEHQKEQTHAMGVTLPDDYCWHCHQDLDEERPSHKDLAFDSCASAGCHNYHDNRALYEDFLVEHAQDPWLLDIAHEVSQSFTPATAVLPANNPVHAANSNYQNRLAEHPDIAHQWQISSHAKAGVDCGGCHSEKDDDQWIDKPKQTQCKNCHAFETTTFLQGKHGMRLSGELSATLSPMTPGQSSKPFKAEAAHLEQGCNACHGAHEFNPKTAAVEACLGCHNDEHSVAFKGSPHGQLWQQSITGESANVAVTCATCHMPREEQRIKGQTVMAVNHNQNANLRPNEKMIRSTCMDCHGLGFSIDALAAPELIKNNFSGAPEHHIKSIDWALKRANR